MSSSTAPRFDVIVCGSLHLDIVVRSPALPRLDETAVGTSWAQVCGGKGGNQAVHAARAEARTAMIGRVGTDAFGETLAGHLRSAGVDTSAVTTDPEAGSGMSVAIVQDDGDYGAVIVSGANLRLPPAAAAAAWDVLGGARVLVLQNEVPDAVNVAAAQAARARGAAVVLNGAPARAMPEALASLVDILVVNRIEAEMLGAGPVADLDAACDAARLLARPGRCVVVTLGGEGLVAAPASGEPVAIAAIPVETVVSTHGAGDCFVGALAAALARGSDLEGGCRLANAAAAAHVGAKDRH
ncbi:MAG: PfkB family carbohydrate kinase [Alsobacter sp.]